MTYPQQGPWPGWEAQANPGWGAQASPGWGQQPGRYPSWGQSPPPKKKIPIWPFGLAGAILFIGVAAAGLLVFKPWKSKHVDSAEGSIVEFEVTSPNIAQSDFSVGFHSGNSIHDNQHEGYGPCSLTVPSVLPLPFTRICTANKYVRFAEIVSTPGSPHLPVNGSITCAIKVNGQTVISHTFVGKDARNMKCYYDLIGKNEV